MITGLVAAIAVLLLSPAAHASIPLELRFDGRPFRPTAPVDFGCFDVTRNRWTSCEVTETGTPGMYRLARPAPGSWKLHVSIDENGGNPRRYPGDYEAWLTFDVTATGPQRLTVDLPRLIHLVKPGDNAQPLEGMLTSCATQPRFDTPRYAWSPEARVDFAWAPVVAGAEYRYQVGARRCGGSGDEQPVAKGTTTATELTIRLRPTREADHYVFHVSAWKDGRLVGVLYTHDGGTHSWNYRFRVIDATLPRHVYLIAGAALILVVALVSRALVHVDPAQRLVRARRLAAGALCLIAVVAVALAAYQYREANERRRIEAERVAAEQARAARQRDFVAAFVTAAPRPDWWERVHTPYRVDSVGRLLSAWQGHPRGEDGERKFFKAAYQGIVDHPDDEHVVATALSLLPFVVRDYPHHLGLARFGYERYFGHRARTDNCAHCMVGDTTQGIVEHLGRLLAGAGRHDEAIAVLRRLIDERAAEVSPYKLAETWSQLAWAHWNRGDRATAIETAREGLVRYGGTVRGDVLRETLARLEQDPPPTAAPLRATDALPATGSRVRIQARTLAAGWHEGMFNRTRTEPPCYVVLIFEARPTASAAVKISATVHVDDVARLEAFTGPVAPVAEWAGRPSTDTAAERWRLVPLDVLLAANAGCCRRVPPPS